MPSRFQILYDESSWQAYSDCDCSSPLSEPFDRTIPAGPLTLRRHPALRWLALDDEYVVAFVPSASRVVVLDRAALALLDAFAAPRRWQAGPSDADEAIELCYRLGLLVEGDGALPQPPPSDTLAAWLHVTNACNLRCTYCYVDKTDEAMTEATAFAAVDAVLRSARAHGFAKVLLKYAGGEASLNLPLVSETHRYARSRCAALGIELEGVVLSNGTALTTHKIEQIRDLGLRLTISLDGMESMHDQQRPTIGGQGSFRAAIAGIERAQRLGLTPDIAITVTGQSVAGLPELLPWLIERDLRFSLSFYRPIEGISPAELQLDERRIVDGMRAAYAAIALQPPRRSLLGSLLDRTNLGAAHSRTCGVGDSYLVIDQRGAVAKCQMELAQPVTTIAARDPLALIRADQVGVQNLPVDLKQGCRGCEWRYWCAGGCPVATFRATGRYDIQSPNCGIYTALYPDVLRLEGLRLLAHAAPALLAPVLYTSMAHSLAS
ncbi:MAG: radical SAM protein [Kouleothrix sp.]|nr:radical SAM protein [Kouleothrix sp.]